MRRKCKNFIKGVVQYKTEKKLNKLLYEASDERFDKLTTDAVVSYFILRIALIKAIREGNEVVVDRCCRLKTDIDDAKALSFLLEKKQIEHGDYIKPPMHYAAYCGNAKIIKILAPYYSVSEACKFMLDSYGYFLYTEKYELTPLHFASSEEAVICLSELGADIEAFSSWGTPFYRAVCEANKEVMIALYEAGADINCANKDEEMHTPLFMIGRLISQFPAKYAPIYELLCHMGASAFMLDSHGETLPNIWPRKVQPIPLMLLFQNIFLDINDKAIGSYIHEGKLCLESAIELSDKCKGFDSLSARLLRASLYDQTVAHKNSFLKLGSIPHLLCLGFVCKKFHNHIFGADFKFRHDPLASAFLPEEIILHIYSQLCPIRPEIVLCIIRGDVVNKKPDLPKDNGLGR